MTPSTRGVLYLLGAALSWSLGGVLIKLISMEPMAIAGGRSLVAGVALLAFLRHRDAPSVRWSQRHVILGALAYAATVISFVLATRSTTAANAILLQYTAPIYVAILAPVLLNEKIDRRDWIFIAVILAGMVLFFLERVSPVAEIGNVIALGSGVFFALCILALRNGRGKGALKMVILGNGITALVALPWMLDARPQGDDLLLLSVLGLVQLALGYVLFIRGVELVPAIEGVLIPMLEPILNPVWVALVIAEYPSGLAVAGGVLVLAAVAFRGIYRAQRAIEPTYEAPVIPTGGDG